MLTRVNPEGSCYREFRSNADSSFMVGDTARTNPFPVDLDSTWKISWQCITPEIHTGWPLKTWNWDTAHHDKSISVWARRDYQSVEGMALKFKFKKSHVWHDFKARYSLDKKFRWFYTYYLYKEAYPKIKTFDRVPLEKHMTSEEAGFWFTGEPNLLKGMNGVEMEEFISGIEKKFNSWFGHNLWEMNYEALVNNYDFLGDIKISRERLLSAKDSIINLNLNIIEDDLDFVKCMDAYFKTNAFSSLDNIKDNPLKQLDRNIQDQVFKYFEKEIDYRLLLPGKILNANNGVLRGDTLVWKITAYRMVTGDFEIRARSRKANNWAFMLSGIIILGAVGMFFVKTK
jgi:hypothetical protein